MTQIIARLTSRGDTEANWTSNNPVLSAKEIAFSTDAFYTGTDQQKFKVGDGIQTWTQLDYMPIGVSAQTLAQTLTNGNKTGEQDITSDNEFSKAEIKDGQIRLYRTDGLSDFGEIKLTDLLAYLKYTGLTGNGHVTIDDLVNQISHSAEVNLSAPVINGSGELTSISPNTLGVLKALNNLAQLTVDGGGITANLVKTTVSHNSEVQIAAPLIEVSQNPTTALGIATKGFTEGLTWLTNQIWGTWINGLTSKTTPADADQVVLMDSADSNKSKKLSWANIKATLKTYFDTLYNTKGFRGLYAYQNTDSTVTGSTTETVVANIKINGGDMGNNGVLHIDAAFFKSGTAGGITVNIYLSTVGTNTVGSTGVPASSQRIALYSTAASNVYSGRLLRKMVNKNSQSSNYIYSQSTNSVNDFAASLAARTAVNINTANDFWLVITITNISAADTCGLSDVQLYIDKQ